MQNRPKLTDHLEIAQSDLPKAVSCATVKSLC